MGQYLLTLVPDIAYERQHQGEVAELFINAGDKGGFTGVAIYSIPGLDLIVRANRYTNGIKDWGVHMSGNIKDLNEKVFWLKSILRPFKLLRCPDIQSRGMGEDIIIEWIKSGKTVVKSGNDWLFTDLDRSQFIMMDSDKDGEPDTIVIGPENGGGENTEPTPDPDPMIVGVDHTPGTTYNTDHTTDHFVVVYARGYDEEKKQYYYNYIETGRKKENENEAFSHSNRLYYDSNKKSYEGIKWDGKKKYSLVQIRTNLK